MKALEAGIEPWTWTEDGRTALGRRAASHYVGDEDFTLTLLAYRENAVYKVETASDRFVLRLHQPSYRSRAEILSEFMWLDALSSAGETVPLPHQTPDGRRVLNLGESAQSGVALASALTWVDGSPVPEDEIGSVFPTLGALAGRLHRQASRWNTPYDFTRWSLDASGGFGPNGVWGDYREYGGLAQDELRVLDAAADKLRLALEAYGRNDRNFGLIHADLIIENILLRPEGAALIDFDDCGHGWFLYDIGSAVFMYANDPQCEVLVRQWLDGYSTERELSDADLEMVPSFIMMRLLGLLGWPARQPSHPVSIELGPWLCEQTLAYAQTYLTQRPPHTHETEQKRTTHG